MIRETISIETKDKSVKSSKQMQVITYTSTQ